MNILHETKAFEIDAAAFAKDAHGRINQRRKYTNEPYIVHPKAVAEIVKSVTDDNAMICAAWLHDTVEDAGVTLQEIEEKFGSEVMVLVEMLTDVSKASDGNREVRKRIDLEHTAKASPAAKTIKLADLIDNTKTIVKYDPGFAKIYLKEKRALLEVLKEGNQELWDIANEQCEIESL